MQINYPDLPIVEKKQAIIDALKNHQVIVVAGDTGSGKTTQLPKICLEAGLGQNGLIGHTQPRRIAARTVCERIASELQTSVGDLVGFKVRFSDKTNPQTRIKIMTDGILLSEMQFDKYLSQYECIIVDEAHERSLNIDFLLGFLKRLIKKRPELKVIITSATIDVAKFSAFFHDAPIIEIEGRTYPIEVNYLPENALSERDPALMIVDTIKEICKKGPGDILIFLSGEKEIRDLMQVISENVQGLTLLPLFARLSVRDQQKVFLPSKQRKVILATNVAETSITVPNVRFVIDEGFVRMSRYQYRSKLQRLPIEPVSQASANQRKGRCGRVGPGICYRLYTEDDFLKRPLFTEPEILRTNLAGVILKMLSLGIEKITSFPFLDAPDHRYIKDGFTLLQHLCAVDKENKITALGKMLANIPIEPRLARILLAGNQYGTLKEILIIVSALSIADPRERPLEFQEKANQQHAQFADERSDFISYINLWHFVKEKRKALSHQKFRKLCQTNFLSFIRICEWFDIYTQLLETCKELRLKLNQVDADYSVIHKALLTGCIDKIGIKEEKTLYLGARQLKFNLHPGSVLVKKPPLWVMAYEIVHTHKTYARTNAKVEVTWLEEVGRPLLKKQVDAPFYSKKQGQVLARERSTLFGLLVAEKKVVYEKHFLKEAREIFIQQGLVEEALDNNPVVLSLKQLEERFRHRYHLVDERAIYQFYDSKIPAHIASMFALDKWLKREGKGLALTSEEVAACVLPKEVFQDFPEFLQIDNQQYALEYHYDLTSEEDGITVLVPIAALLNLKDYDFSWVIRGLLNEKVGAYLRALPKSYRAAFMPMENYITKVMACIKPEQGTFDEALVKALAKLSQIKIAPDYWDGKPLPSYLRFHFKVLDKKGEILKKGDSITALYENLKAENAAYFSVGHALQVENRVTWDFENLPKQIVIKKNNHAYTLYPALVDNMESVSVSLFDKMEEAARHHPKGLTRLYLLQLKENCRIAMRDVTPANKKMLSKLYAPWGSLDDFFAAIFYQCAYILFVENNPQIKEAALFAENLAANRQDYLLLVKQVITLLLDILQQYHTLTQKMDTLKEEYKPALIDIRQQCDRLFQADFIKQTPLKWLKRYPLYLKSIQNRLDMLPRALSKDKTLMDDIQSVQKAYSKLLPNKQQDLSDFLWKIEELRLSYFAQGLRTVEPVSKIRLLKLLESIK